MKIKDIELHWLLKAEWGDFESFLDYEPPPPTGREEDAFVLYKLGDISFEWLEDFEQGQREPILVRKMGKNNYRLLNGHHRLFAAMLLGWDTLKAAVLDVDECYDDVWEISSDSESSTYYKSHGGSIDVML